MNRSRQGFTLIEVVLVCAVMMGLCAICFSVGVRVKEQGRRQVCTSNLRQIGLSLQMYAQDNESGSSTPDLPLGLPDMYPRYISDQRLFLCPDAPSEDTADDSPSDSSTIPCNYAYQYLPLFAAGPEDPPDAIFDYQYKKRGGNYPIVYDTNHFANLTDLSPTLVLRLDGRVQLVQQRLGNSDEL